MADEMQPFLAVLADHEPHEWEEVAPCVYCKPCGVRLYTGTLPPERDPGRAAREALCDHEWDPERGMGFYIVCMRCGRQEWPE